MSWTPEFTPSFWRGYRNLDFGVRRRVDEAIRTLLEAKDPRARSHRLHGRWQGCYSYEIGRRYRVIFAVEANTIRFLRVGPHTIYR
ncbi:MAG: type II toxin-antitoxin system RelE/ParE family toxin [Candidatus Bathyarchaeia archaeon]